MGQVFVTSDWHFCHDRDFVYEPRGFSNIWEMTGEIIRRHNEVVQPEDDVYVLGDLMLNNNDAGMHAIKQLNGQLHIVRGNHDTNTRMELYKQCPNIVEVCEGKFLKHDKYNFFLSHYPCLTSNLDDDKPLYKRVINLCGHSHTQDPFTDFDKGLIYHIEMDAHNCYPVLIDNIIYDLKELANEK
jgi:calcineurin-like phosphoesterase family protein